MSDLEHRSSASQDEDSEDVDFSAPRKSRPSAPQLQAQLSRLCDRTRPRRLKNSWQQVRRIEDLCHMSPTSGFILDACAGSVLTPHDYITNVQKRFGNRTWTGCVECRLCGSFLDPRLEHGRNLQHRRSHSRALRMRSRCGVRIETCRPRHYH